NHAGAAAADAMDLTTRAPPAAEGGGGLGKEVSSLPALLHHLGARQAADLADRLSPHQLDTLEALLWNEEIARTESGNIKVERKLHELQTQLAASPDWIGAIAGPVMILLRQTGLYLGSPYHLGTTM